MHPIRDAIEFLEKSNAELQPELLSAETARSLLELYSRAKKLAAYGETQLARKVDDAKVVARTTGVSVGQAKATVETAKALRESDAVSAAFGGGDISFEQASEIAKADKARPGSADELLRVAKTENFNVLKEQARKVVLEAEQHRGLGQRQREARSARSYIDALGMVNLNLRLQPLVGTPFVNRAEAEASRRFKKAKQHGDPEPFERYLADAYAAMLEGSPVKGNSKRSDVMILVSHEVTQRGWKDVREGEFCKVPGIGPIPPEEAKEIAKDAFLTGVFFDGKDLRQIKSWTRDKPVELQRALQLGDPPGFDGIKCVDCGARFRVQGDHIEPFVGGLNPTCLANNDWRCPPCHAIKTEKDRKTGKLKRPVSCIETEGSNRLRGPKPSETRQPPPDP